MSNEKNRTIWVGNLDKEVTEELLYELFLQAGPLEKVKIPKGNYGFVTYIYEDSVPYALQLFDGVALFNRQLNIKPQGQTLQPQQDYQHFKRNHSNSRGNESSYKHMRFNDDNLMPPPPTPKFHSHLLQHSYEDLLRLGEQMKILNNGNFDHGASTSVESGDYNDHRDDRHDNRRPRHHQDRQRDNNRRNFNRRDHHGGRDYHNRSNGNRFRRH